MRTLKSHPLLKMVNSYLIDSAQPSNLSYWWNFGSLLGACLGIQILSGVFLAMHYNPSVAEAFNSVEHIMRDVNNGWLIRYLHSNTASAFFFIVYLHIGRGLYYGSYKSPRILVWGIGTVIFILMMATAFMGYVLPYGQMSFWGATVITNLLSAIPWVGQDLVDFVLGGFSVSNATLNRFFALHFLLPFVLAALVLMHLIALHDRAGSSNPLGISGNNDRLPFSPYFTFKDLITIFIFIFVLSLFVFFMPNALGDSENYVEANPMSTPASIVPEWYLLPFYAILRSIPSKGLGVVAMFSSLLILLALPVLDRSNIRGMQFKPLMRIFFWIFVANFLVLMRIGGLHPEEPYITIGFISTVFYFAWFLIILPIVSLIENSLISFNGLEPRREISRTKVSSAAAKSINNVRHYSTSTTRGQLAKEKHVSDKENSVSGKVVPLVVYDDMGLLKKQIYKDNKGRSGVYRITNKINGKQYIGSSKDLRSRFAHYLSIETIKVDSMTICKSLLKNGYSNFKLEILEYCDADKRFEIESNYLKQLKPEYNIVYDTAPFTPETILKMSENHPRSVKVYITDLETNTKIICNSIRHAALSLGISRSTVTKLALASSSPLLGRYILEVVDESNDPQQEKSSSLEIPKNDGVIVRAFKNSKVQIKVLDLESNTTTIYDSIRQASVALSCRHSAIQYCINTPDSRPFRDKYLITRNGE